jgi:tetratricopeptide (TPR) repeat protein
VPFFCTARYRMPVIPPLILLAVFAIGEGIQTAKERRWKSMAGMAVALVLGSLLVHVTPHTQAREDDLVSHVVVGNVYNDRGQPKAALSHYRRALELAPGDLAAACGLGEVLTTLNRLPEGIPQLRRALSGPRVPRSGETPEMLASTHSSLANALAQTGQYDEAIRHYREAIRLNPRGAKGADQLNLGLVLQALGRNEEAVEVLRQSIEINPEFPIAHLALGRSLLALGRTAEAIPPLRQATAASPRDPQAWFELGRALATEGHTAEAKETLQTSLRLNPRLEEARRLLNSVERQAPRR